MMTEDKIISELESEIKRAEYVDRDYVDSVDVDLLSSSLELIKRQKEALDVVSVKHGEWEGYTHSRFYGTDKNGTKIFEGDIVRLTDDTGIENTFIITWDSRRAMFYLDSPTFKTDFYYYSANEFEVIGNIHDNPELLGELMKLTSKDVAQSGLAPATENFELMPG